MVFLPGRTQSIFLVILGWKILGKKSWHLDQSSTVSFVDLKYLEGLPYSVRPHPEAVAMLPPLWRSVETGIFFTFSLYSTGSFRTMTEKSWSKSRKLKPGCFSIRSISCSRPKSRIRMTRLINWKWAWMRKLRKLRERVKENKYNETYEDLITKKNY